MGLSNEWIVVPEREPSGGSPPSVAWDLLEQTPTLFSAQRLPVSSRCTPLRRRNADGTDDRLDVAVASDPMPPGCRGG